MSNERKVWLNGELIPWQQATVPLLSHGFSRGSAIFEVFGTHVSPNGVMAFRMDEHLKRLERSARLLGMELAYSTDTIVQGVIETVRANNLGRGLIKILAYWGEEAIIQLVLDSKLDVAIFAIPDSEELGLDRAKPISACLSKWRKIHPETVPVGAKACSNYLNGYLARRDAYERGYDVGILLGTDGFLAEGSIESVFIVQGGVLKTPPLGRILSGITRLSVLQASQAVGIPVSEEPILREDLFEAEEIFTTHSGIKVSPVARFEDRELEAPGPITRQLMELMDDITNFRDDRFQHWFQPLN
ncbi:MAG: aminotransferase class IV [Deltaproteobacteria bacterium]|nr:aminotransferase class IV [Deltaproteobacteria bacterium]MBW1960331.1 aminotransferase class IV [Deltaproteobacteria bacterium]MBW1994530.1 aminotransferase class IV [Deltaproteobacteria bacterium]MBW2154070.1 aminotransferase class IV [Deltaproteobacteria bacterium]